MKSMPQLGSSIALKTYPEDFATGVLFYGWEGGGDETRNNAFQATGHAGAELERS